MGGLVVRYNRGNIVDVGCGTCQIYHHLIGSGWKGKYIGVDVTAYENHTYPQEVSLMFGDALELDLPRSDTYILYDILEHVEEPVKLLAKCLDHAKNVLVAVPKRNEDLWKFGIVEYHQLDRTHKHWGFTEPEIRHLIELSGGGILQYKELMETDLLTVFGAFSQSQALARAMRWLLRLFPTKVYHQELWCEVSRA
jgi:SAM-dependent methyltransferase